MNFTGAATNTDANVTPGTEPLSILLASANSQEADAVEQSLREAGEGWYHLKTASALTDVYAIPDNGGYDVALIDWRCRGMSLNSIPGLRVQAPTTALILLTSPEDTSIEIKAIRAGFEECLCLRNVQGPALRSLLRNAANRRKLATESETKSILRRRELEKLLQIDEETGLYNEAQFTDRLHKELLRSMRYGNKFTLALFELDDYQIIADTYGPESFRTVLRMLAEIVKHNVRKIDETGRIQKARFGVLCIESAVPQANVLVQRLLLQVGSRPLTLGFGKNLQASLSCGMIEWSRSITEPDTMLAGASDALRQAKEKGKGKVEAKVIK